VSDSNFWLERIALEADLRGIDLEGMPLAISALDKPVEVEARGTTMRLAPYETAVVPAELEVVMVRGLADGAQILAAAPPARRDSVALRFSRAAVDYNASSAYFAQFPG
jgi:hypothetical protein